ncbi:hypoxanthine phosphoribosyltransferase [Arcanobacterium hippocoleae]
MQLQDIGDAIEKVLYTKAEIDARLGEMGAEISHDYAGKDLLLVGVLKGAIMVVADLSRKISIPAKMDWMAVSSYGASTKSSGVVRILKDLGEDVQGRNVLIVEDIIDSGLTLAWLKENLEARGAASVRIATAFRKPEALKVDVEVDYVGFDIANEFVVGYGLDYAENYRHLDFVGVLSPHIYAAEAAQAE